VYGGKKITTEMKDVSIYEGVAEIAKKGGGGTRAVTVTTMITFKDIVARLFLWAKAETLVEALLTLMAACFNLPFELMLLEVGAG
jgi:hypothetical protein